jgi:hypothetical protein
LTPFQTAAIIMKTRGDNMDAKSIHVWELQQLRRKLDAQSIPHVMYTLHKDGRWYLVEYNTDTMRFAEHPLTQRDLTELRAGDWTQEHLALRVVSVPRDLYIVMFGGHKHLERVSELIADTLFINDCKPHTYMLDAKKETR